MTENKLPKFAVGDVFPDFTLGDEKGNQVNLYKILDSGKNVMLIFYPGDMTPGCTGQLCGVNDIFSKFDDKNIAIFGVNHADEKSHQKFIDKYGFQFPILVDNNRNFASSIGQIKFMFGNKSIKRGCYVISPDKKIIYKKHEYQDNDEILGLIK